MMAYKDAQDYLPQFRAIIQSKLLNPLQGCSSEDDKIPGLGDFDQSELGLDLRAALGQFLKERSDKVNTDAMCERLWSQFEPKPPEKVKMYLNEVCRLVWRMVVQKPPMKFLTTDLDQQPINDKHEIYYDEDIVNRDAQYVISSYIYPIFTQKGKVLRKGKVFVKPEGEVVQDNVAATIPIEAASVSSQCKTSDIQGEEIDPSEEKQEIVFEQQESLKREISNLTEKNAQLVQELEDLRTHQMSRQMQYKSAEEESALENINSKNGPSDRLRQDHQRALAALNDKENELKKYRSLYQQVFDENNCLKHEQCDKSDRLRNDHQRALEDKEIELKKYRSLYQQVFDENNRLKHVQYDESTRLRQDLQRALAALNDKDNELKKYRSLYQQVFDETSRLKHEQCDESTRLRQDLQRALAALNDKDNELKKYRTDKVSTRISNIDDDESENQIESAHPDVVLEKESLLQHQQHTSQQPGHLQTKAMKGKKKASKIEAEMNVNKEQIAAFQHIVADLQERISTLTRDKETANIKYEEGKAIYTETIRNLRSTQAELTSTQAELTSTQYNPTLTQAEPTSTQYNPASTQAELTSNQAELSSNQAELASTRCANEKLELQLVQLQSEHERLLMAEKLKKKDLSKKLKERDRFLADVENQFDYMNRSYQDKDNVISQLNEEMSELLDSLRRHLQVKEDKETANMKYEEGKVIYSEKIHFLRSTQAELTSPKEELTSSKVKLTSMQEKLTSTQAKLTSTTVELTSTQVGLSSSLDKLASTQFKLTLTQAELASTQDELASTLIANKELELQLVQFRSEQDKLKLEKKDLRKNIKERDRFVADIENQFDDMKRSYKDSQTQLKQQNAAVEGLQNELFQTNRQIEQLQQDCTDNATNEVEYQDKDDVIRQLNEEMSEFRDSMRRQLQVKDDENMALRLALENEERQTARRQDDCASVESLGSDLATSKNRIKRLQAEVSRQTSRLSKQMHQKLNEDESALENINSKNRPSKIVEDYQEMMTSEWLDAKDALDTMYPDETLEQMKIAFLTSVLMDAHNLAEEQLTLHKRHLHNLLLNPINGAAEAARGYTAEEEQGAASRAESVPISRDLVAALTAFIKDHSDTANVHQLSEMVMSRLKDKPHCNSIICNLEDDRALMEFVKSSCALVWRMVVQEPPLTLSTPDLGQPPTKDKHEVYFDCPKHPANVIVSYVEPVIVQNSKNLTKGKVFVAPRE